MTSSVNFKELKKLAAACRKAGIKSYKDSNFEFTLADHLPSVTRRSKKASRMPTAATGPFETDSLTDEQLLMWSSSLDGDKTEEEGTA